MRRPAGKPKTKNRGKDKYTVTEVGTLIDQFRGEFKVFGEDLSVVKEDVKSTKEMVAKNTERITLLEIAIRNLTDRVAKNTDAITVLSQKLENLTDRVAKNTDAITVFSQKLENLTKSIDNLIKTKADREEFQVLDKRLSALEAKVASLSR